MTDVTVTQADLEFVRKMADEFLPDMDTPSLDARYTSLMAAIKNGVAYGRRANHAQGEAVACGECRGTGVAEVIQGYDRPCDACRGKGTHPPAQDVAALVEDAYREGYSHGYNTAGLFDRKDPEAKEWCWEASEARTALANYGAKP